MHELIARIVDRSEFDEYKPDYGRTVLCGYARIGGHAVGIVANQKQHQPQISHTGEKRIEFGGVIYAESAEKAARFIMDCNQNLVPLIFLHDVNGFMVGRDAEWSGIIRAGAKMVTAVSNSTVPKITVIVGGSYGAGNYAMCGKAYDPRFIFAWPTARYAVMSGASAANTLVEIRIRQLERGGKKLSDEEKQELLASIKATYDQQTDCRYAAARLWVDAIIDPAKTREAILTPRSKPPPSIPTCRNSTSAFCKHDGLKSRHDHPRQRARRTLRRPTVPCGRTSSGPSRPASIPASSSTVKSFRSPAPIHRTAAMLAGHGYIVAVPEIYHEFEPAGTVLAYDQAGSDRGNQWKTTKELASYDADARAVLDHLKSRD